jgi:hypothetical protein
MAMRENAEGPNSWASISPDIVIAFVLPQHAGLAGASGCVLPLDRAVYTWIKSVSGHARFWEYVSFLGPVLGMFIILSSMAGRFTVCGRCHEGQSIHHLSCRAAFWVCGGQAKEEKGIQRDEEMNYVS